MMTIDRGAGSFYAMGRLALAVTIAGCTADSLVLPSEGEPVHISIVDGNGQQGTAGRPLTGSLIISITDGESRPVVNRNVSFEIPSGAAISPGQVNTDANGRAIFRWVLGPSAGSQTLAVGFGSPGKLAPKVTFSAIATPGPVNAINAVSGDGQVGQAGTRLTLPLVVRLLDSYGNGVPGTDVIWQVSTGSLSNSTVETGADGSALVTWTLGIGAGVQSATARFQGANGSPITFTATAMQAGSPRLGVVTQPSVSAESGVILARQPSVRLENSQGDPVAQAGVAITAAIATGGGTLSGNATVSTNASGIAQFTDLAINGTTGNRTLIFAAAGHTTAISEKIDLSAPRPSATRSTITATPSTIQAGNGQSTITVTARDNGGNPIAGLPVVIGMTGNGNTVTQPASLTNSSGVATGTVSSSIAEPKTLSAEIDSVPVSGIATVTVVSSTGPSAQHSTAYVPGGKAFRWTTITITTRDDSGNRLNRGGYGSQIGVSVSGVNTVSNVSVNDEDDGTYEASYFPIFRGNDDITITINGAPIPGSPFRSRVR